MKATTVDFANYLMNIHIHILLMHWSSYLCINVCVCVFHSIAWWGLALALRAWTHASPRSGQVSSQCCNGDDSSMTDESFCHICLAFLAFAFCGATDALVALSDRIEKTAACGFGMTRLWQRPWAWSDNVLFPLRRAGCSCLPALQSYLFVVEEAESASGGALCTVSASIVVELLSLLRPAKFVTSAHAGMLMLAQSRGQPRCVTPHAWCPMRFRSCLLFVFIRNVETSRLRVGERASEREKDWKEIGKRKNAKKTSWIFYLEEEVISP